MMSRRLIQKASSGFPTYRESTPRSNGKLIYAKVCCSTDNFFNVLKFKVFYRGIPKRSGRKPVICLTIRAACQALSDLAFSKNLAFYAGFRVSSIECYCFYR
ncbi:hypothetical protein DSF06_12225 [Salmonella enterica subsp. enterica]|nr:hypothetical protein [Salmonella enterica subsp. enterica serovar Veneziana]EAA7085525.1 hypothetical protein [Salmonella enterica subsp. enterica serovar Veneziana]EBV3062878.1 hypothetical protein [Salmonella enterica subsp. enterica serovar Veneziana]